MMRTEWLAIDVARESERIALKLRDVLARDLRRQGVVVGLSGGIDSSVTAALAVKALGRERVVGLLMPERHSAGDTLPLSRLVADALGIEWLDEDITGVLEALGFYSRYETAVRRVFPEFTSAWKSKIAIRGAAQKGGFNYFVVVAQSPAGEVVERRLSPTAYLEIVAATNFKQRTRKMLEYYHADRLNYAVGGTPNRLEFDQGFFVKGGDGAADVKPIAHLYKTQVYQLAEHLGVPAEVRRRPPTTDTYSLPQGQDEFYFAVPYQQMDLCLYGRNHGKTADEVAEASGLERATVERVWIDIDRKRATTRSLHLPGLLLGDVPEISAIQHD
jgi:NAD+ synthase